MAQTSYVDTIRLRLTRESGTLQGHGRRNIAAEMVQQGLAHHSDLFFAPRAPVDAYAITHGLQGWVDRLPSLRELTEEYVASLNDLRAQADDHGRAQADLQQQRLKLTECTERRVARRGCGAGSLVVPPGALWHNEGPGRPLHRLGPGRPGDPPRRRWPRAAAQDCPLHRRRGTPAPPA